MEGWVKLIYENVFRLLQIPSLLMTCFFSCVLLNLAIIGGHLNKNVQGVL